MLVSEDTENVECSFTCYLLKDKLRREVSIQFGQGGATNARIRKRGAYLDP